MTAATLAVLNARIWTGDPRRPWAEALAARGDVLVAVGTAAEVRGWMDDATEVIDAGGRMVVPGFIDAHLHFLPGGFRLAGVQLRGVQTPEAFVERLRGFAATVPPGTWITGGDWDHMVWGGTLPHRAWIDEAVPQHPVWVSRQDGHMALANSLALAYAGLDATTPDPPGGTLVRDPDGSLTGILKDTAMPLIERVIPPPTEAQEDAAMEAAMNYTAAHGVTSAHHMGTWEDLAVFQRTHRRGALRTRLYAAVQLPTWPRLRDAIAADGPGDDWLRIGGLKAFADGSLGSRTAAFFEPYADDPANTGLLIHEPETLYEWFVEADAAGLHLITHTIGDRAVRLVLDGYARAAEVNGPRDRRPRIEHAQHIHPDDLDRFAPLGVVASVQPYHLIDDACWAGSALGAERLRTTYAFRSLLDRGVRLAAGSDWFVAPPTPLEGLYAAITRRPLDGTHPGGWIGEERITLEEALRAYTVDAAYASFEEHRKGTLAPGFLADFVLLDRDLFQGPPEAVREAHVLRTVVGGRTVFSSAPAVAPVAVSPFSNPSIGLS